MANLNDIYEQSVIDRGFVAHAVDAGIVTTITSLISGQGTTKPLLLSNVKDALISDNEALANSLNLDTLQLVLDYMGRIGVPPIVIAQDSPIVIDENGPAGTWTSDGGSDQINVTFSEPTAGQLSGAFSTYTYELYGNGVFMKSGSLAAAGGTIDESFVIIGGSVVHTRVVFVNANNEMSRTGPVSTVNR